jgi:hypothetical protein
MFSLLAKVQLRSEYRARGRPRAVQGTKSVLGQGCQPWRRSVPLAQPLFSGDPALLRGLKI